MEQNKNQSNNFVSILNISASIASLAGFMVMIFEKTDLHLDWGIIISYLGLSIWIIATSALSIYYFIYYPWKCVLKNQHISWISLALFCFILFLFVEIVLIKLGQFFIFDFLKLLIVGHT